MHTPATRLHRGVSPTQTKKTTFSGGVRTGRRRGARGITQSQRTKSRVVGKRGGGEAAAEGVLMDTGVDERKETAEWAARAQMGGT